MKSWRFLSLLTIMAMVATGMLVGLSPNQADAAPVDCLAGPDWVVSDETELNDAIGCYNAALVAGSYTITLDAEITSTLNFARSGEQSLFDWITQSGVGLDLTIDGAGFAANRALTNLTSGTHVLGISDTQTAEVTLENIGLTGGLGHGLFVDNGDVDVHNSLIEANGLGGVSAIGAAVVDVIDSAISANGDAGVVVDTGSSVVIDNSRITVNLGPGVEVIDGTVITTDSTIDLNPQGFVNSGGDLFVLNSTVFGTGLPLDYNVWGQAGTTLISNSTLTGALGSLGNPVHEDGGVVEVVSSIIDNCSGTLLDSGNNVGDCFLTSVSLDALLDNGCTTATPLGCVPTIDLIAGTIAIGSGLCDGVEIFDAGTRSIVTATLTLDQQGEPRTPAGLGCDAGSVEADGIPCLTGPNWTVNNEAELNVALACYNLAVDPGPYTITLGQDIQSTSDFVLAGDLSSFEWITQAAAGLDLTINGAGNSLLGLDDGTYRAVLGLNATNTTVVNVTDMTISGGPYASAVVSFGAVFTGARVALTDSLVGVEADGSVITLADSAITENTEGGLELVNGTTATLTNVIIKASGDAIDLADSVLTVKDSTIIDNDSGLNVSDGNVTLISSTVVDNTIGITASGASTQVDIDNSTVVGNDVSATVGAAITALSSIIESCTGVTDDGANVGGCFGTPLTTHPAVDAGCLTPTPIGCVPTIPLAPGSLAIDAGNCTSNATDQRGEARTPMGVGCDSGSFENGADDVYCVSRWVTMNLATNGGNGIGTPGEDVIMGTAGPDDISGRGGKDIICAGDGDDTINGGASADTIYAGLGNDIVNGGNGADVIDGGDGNDVIRGGDGRDIIDGGAGDDVIEGQRTADVLRGGPGDDTVSGGHGADDIEGNEGADVLTGNVGPDVLRGGDGNDDLGGGKGNDTMFGGAGTDRCAGHTGTGDQAEAATCEVIFGVEILF